MRKGFAHIILLFVVVAALVVGGYLYFKVFNVRLIDEDWHVTSSSPTLTPTPAETEFEKELEKIQPSDSAEDFGEVDKDISNL